MHGLLLLQGCFSQDLLYVRRQPIISGFKNLQPCSSWDATLSRSGGRLASKSQYASYFSAKRLCKSPSDRYQRMRCISSMASVSFLVNYVYPGELEMVIFKIQTQLRSLYKVSQPCVQILSSQVSDSLKLIITCGQLLLLNGRLRYFFFENSFNALDVVENIYE